MFYSFVLQSPEYINNNFIYRTLARYDINEDDLEFDVFRYFEDLKSRFKNNKLQVFESEFQPHFLQFRNCDSSNIECVKIYLSFPKEDIYRYVNLVFDYIEKNNMPTLSKVSDKMRSDAVVLRMVNVEDAKKVVNYVNNILNNNDVKKVNPFLLKDGVTGLASDGNLSYNSTLTFILEKYFKYCKDYDQLDKVSYEDFRIFSQQLFNVIFKENDFNSFMETDIYRKNRARFSDDASCLANYYRVMMLITKSLDPNYSLEDYYQYVELCQKNEKTKDLEQHFSKIINHQNSQEERPNPKVILDQYILYAIEKYGIHNVKNYIISYIDGNNAAITRDNNFRKQFMNYVTREAIQQITNCNIEEYIVRINNINKENILYEASLATTEKYGSNQTYAALTNAINGNYKFFTNSGDNKYRSKLINKVGPNEIKELCTRTLIKEGFDYDEDILKSYCYMIEKKLNNDYHK